LAVNLHELLERLLRGTDLEEREAGELLAVLAAPGVEPALAGALLAALRAKGVSAAELRGLATMMRKLARRPQLPAPVRAVDIVGTGGDKSGSLNLSTGAALLAAAAGAPVVKHGNRALSSRAGSADVLEALGLPVVLDERRAGECFAATGFAFLYAPHYHPAMKTIAPVRTALGVRTVFNILGPLTNPAAPPCAVIGAFDLPTAGLIAEALAGMDIERAFVIHGAAGWDEPTPIGPFDLYDVRGNAHGGTVRRERRDAADYGLAHCEADELAGGDAVHNAGLLRRVLVEREPGARRDALLLGAALALEVSGAEREPRAAVARLERTIDSGEAAAWLSKLAQFGATRVGQA
jgi:anthranilate phosphoribosyltransferase